MPAISMSAVEVLPELLRFFGTEGKEGKKRTTRPGWKIVPILDTGYEAIKPKEPTYKVGDICKIYWKQRTSPKGSIFCRKCGFLFKPEYVGHSCAGTSEIYPIDEVKFPKLIGEVKITEVFKIEMWKFNTENQARDMFGMRTVPGRTMSFHETLKFALEDGFRRDHAPVDQMFEYFHKTHNLDEGKPLYSYKYDFVRSYL